MVLIHKNRYPSIKNYLLSNVSQFDLLKSFTLNYPAIGIYFIGITTAFSVGKGETEGGERPTGLESVFNVSVQLSSTLFSPYTPSFHRIMIYFHDY